MVKIQQNQLVQKRGVNLLLFVNVFSEIVLLLAAAVYHNVSPARHVEAEGL